MAHSICARSSLKIGKYVNILKALQNPHLSLHIIAQASWFPLSSHYKILTTSQICHMCFKFSCFFHTTPSFPYFSLPWDSPREHPIDIQDSFYTLFPGSSLSQTCQRFLLLCLQWILSEFCYRICNIIGLICL